MLSQAKVYWPLLITKPCALQNDEIAPHVASPDDSARHDSFVSTPTEMSRDENWATRSTAASSTAGDGTHSAH